MIKLNNLLIYLYFFFAIVSCNTASNDHNISYDEFQRTVNMSEKLIGEYSFEGCLDPNYINVFDSLIIFTQNKLESGIFSFYSLKTHELIASFGSQGKAPGEFINAAWTEIDKIHGLIWFIDYPKTTFYAYKIEDIILKTNNLNPVKEIKFDRSLMPIFNFVVLEDTSILIPSSSKKDLYTIIKPNGTLKNVFGTQPAFNGENLPQRAYNDLHSRLVGINNKENELVFSYQYYDKLLKYNPVTEETIIVTGPDKIKQKPIATSNGVLRKTLTTEIGYFFSLKTNNEKIFALYKGKQSFNQDFTQIAPNNIHVFNWRLEPKLNLLFDKDILSFDINESGTIIYAITNSEKNILVYKLD